MENAKRKSAETFSHTNREMEVILLPAGRDPRAGHVRWLERVDRFTCLVDSRDLLFRKYEIYFEAEPFWYLR